MPPADVQFNTVVTGVASPAMHPASAATSAIPAIVAAFFLLLPKCLWSDVNEFLTRLKADGGGSCACTSTNTEKE